MREHAAGRFDAARAFYEQILRADPDHADALHLSGILEAQCGHRDRAAASIERAIQIDPLSPMFRNNLGNVHLECARFDAAEACYLRAIELDPGRPDTLNNLGVLLGRRGRADEGAKLLARALELAPDFADARLNLANLLLREGRLGEAVELCAKGMVVAPRSAALSRLLGLGYSMMGRHEQAAAVYRAWLRRDPGNPVAEFHLAACVGAGVPERAPDAYVKKIFDQFALSFDAKLAELDYQAPALVAAALARCGPPARRSLDVLDAGCGTGLCGPLLAPWARRLIGVDLSEGMLAKAAARGVYAELAAAELQGFMKARRGAFDLIVAADALIYFGALDGLARAVAGALRADGLVIFTLEAHADEALGGYRLQHHGRYSHSRRCIVTAFGGAGFRMLELTPVTPRTEAHQPVDGWLVCARAGD